ncbi:GD22720 [Drosophila simulans]|uniref:GD22720 n=1 Tax=Drosophila simulans TaxID=7240 RepID=B4QA42_DROSI|nr:GD22720 [Drosophila simulans]
MSTIKLLIIGQLWLSIGLISGDDSLDTREGVDLVLKCRFTEHYDSTDFTFYWARWTCCPTLFENVAIGDVQLNLNYRHRQPGSRNQEPGLGSQDQGPAPGFRFPMRSQWQRLSPSPLM